MEPDRNHPLRTDYSVKCARAQVIHPSMLHISLPLPVHRWNRSGNTDISWFSLEKYIYDTILLKKSILFSKFPEKTFFKRKSPRTTRLFLIAFLAALPKRRGKAKSDVGFEPLSPLRQSRPNSIGRRADIFFNIKPFLITLKFPNTFLPFALKFSNAFP